MSSYIHKARFVPKTKTIKNATQYKTVEIDSNKRNPTDKDVRKIKNKFRNMISGYAFKNHWRLYDIKTRYYNDNINSVDIFKNQICEHNKIYNINSSKSLYEEYYQIHHNRSVSSRRIADIISEFYEIDDIKVICDSPTITSIQYKWVKNF